MLQQFVNAQRVLQGTPANALDDFAISTGAYCAQAIGIASLSCARFQRGDLLAQEDSGHLIRPLSSYERSATMKNDEGEVVDLYIPRKW